MRDKITRWCRHPRSTNEKRANCDPGVRKFVRGKRLPANLPDTWDDMPTIVTNSWKDKRKTQYHVDGRGKKHTIVLDENKLGLVWRLEEYFKDHDIPSEVRRLYRVETRMITRQRVWGIIGTERREYVRSIRPKKSSKKNLTTYETVIYWTDKRGWVWKDLPKPQVRNYQYDIGHEITWWCNKDIDIDRIIESCNWT